VGQSLLTERRFLPLFLSQFASALGDTVLRTALTALALFTTGGKSWLVAAASATFVLPTILLSGLGGELADAGDKARLIRGIKLAELPVVALSAFGLATGEVGIVFAGLAGAGVLAALFGPVKYGILPDHLPGRRLPQANALVEGATFVAILAGSVGGSLMAGRQGGAVAAGLILLLAAFSWIAARRIPAAPPSSGRFAPCVNLVASSWRLVRDLRSDRRSWRAALAASWFWTVGAAVLALLPGLVRDVFGGDALWNGLLLGLFAVGIGAGSLSASFLAGGRTILLPCAIGSGMLGAALLGAWQAALAVAPVPLAGFLFLAAWGAGLVAVPAQSAVQAWAPPARRARAVGGQNVLSALGMAVISLLLIAAQTCGWTEPALLGLLGAASILVAILLGRLLPAHPAAEFAWMLFRLAYRVSVVGAEHQPRPGRPVLLTPNHVSWLDAALLYALSDTPPLFVINAAVAHLWWVRPFLRLVPTLPVDPETPFVVRAAVQALQAGQSVVIFPEGRITVTGALMEIRDGAATVADHAGVPVQPVRIQGLERTPFGRLAPRQTRRALWPQVTVTFLEPRLLPEPGGTCDRLRRTVLTAALRDAMEEAVTLTIATDRTMFAAVAEAARFHGLGRLATQDPVSGALSYRRLLAAADVLGGRLAPLGRTDRPLGILLPTSNAAACCLLGLWSHGRVPAMLNATAGLAGLRAAIAAARIERIVTSRAFVERAGLEATVAALHGVELVYLEDVRSAVRRVERVRALLRASLRTCVARVASAPDAPAVIMFTSGSSGTPKGVVLSHRNLLANMAQVVGRIGFDRSDRLMNTLPMFHAFGLTAGFVLPLTNGIPAYLYPSPLHYAAIPEVAYGWNATAIFGTSTFLRGYARRAHPTAFRSVRLVVAGAEPVRQAVRDIWMEKFGLRILEGYGATECSPVLAVNTPASNRNGTVGRLLPLMGLHLEPVEGVDGGRLIVSGPNVMQGYLFADQPGLLHPPAWRGREGWYDTGDIVRCDDDGHLTIVGRAARFAKIAGEMVSLAAVEELAARIWPDAASAAVALPDEARGERVVLVTEQAGATGRQFQMRARALGAADIMLPAELRVVEALPLLGSGKPDLAAVRRLVMGPTAGGMETGAAQLFA